MKTKNKNFKLLFSSTVIIIISIFSCQEKDNKNCDVSKFQSESTFVNNYSKYINASLYLFDLTDQCFKNDDLKNNKKAIIDAASCSLSNDTLTINFGIKTLSLRDKKERKGKIIVKYSGDYFTSDYTAYLSFNNYIEEGIELNSSSFIISNQSNGSNVIYKLQINNFKSSSYSLDADFTLNQSSGVSSPMDYSDDIYYTSGDLSLMNLSNNDSIKGKILENIIIDNTCEYRIVSGIINATTSSDNNFTIDFIASDACKNLINCSVTCESNTFSFGYPID